MKRLICLCLAALLLLLLAACSAGGVNAGGGETTLGGGGTTDPSTDEIWYEEEHGETVDTEPDDTTGSSEFDTEPPFSGVTEDPDYVVTEEIPLEPPFDLETEIETEGTPEGERPIRMYVSGIDSVSVYQSESYASAVIFTLRRGDAVDRISSNGEWSAILIGGEVYYVQSDFLSDSPSA